MFNKSCELSRKFNKLLNIDDDDTKHLMRETYKGSVYIIRNTINDLTYVGSTINRIDYRMKQHISYARHYWGCSKLHRLMRELGIGNFYMQLLEYFPDITKQELHNKENNYVQQYQSKLNTMIPGTCQRLNFNYCPVY